MWLGSKDIPNVSDEQGRLLPHKGVRVSMTRPSTASSILEDGKIIYAGNLPAWWSASPTAAPPTMP